MKKSVSHLLYPIIMMIAAMNFTISCTDEPETEKQAKLPVLEDLTVAVGQTGTIDFNAPLAWTISSDKEWFALGGEQGETSGEAGQQSVPYTVTDQDADFEKTTEANVRIVFSDDRYITFKVTRGTLDRTMTITSDEEGTTPIESIDMDNTMLSYQNMRTFYVSANYDWYYDAAGSSDWIVLSGGALEGAAGETCAVSVYIDQDKAPVEAGTGRIVLSSYDNEPVTEELTVNFGGFGQGYWKIVEVRNGQEFANAYGGCTFSSDGFISQAGMATDQNSVTLKLRSSEEFVFAVTTVDASWQGGLTGIRAHYVYPGGGTPGNGEQWLVISSDDDPSVTEGGLTSSTYSIRVTENVPTDDWMLSQRGLSWLSGEKRTARILCMPKSIWEDEMADGSVPQSDVSRVLTGTAFGFPNGEYGAPYTLKQEYEQYIAFDIVQEAGSGSGDVEYTTIEKPIENWIGTLDSGDGYGNYTYTVTQSTVSSNLNAPFNVSFPSGTEGVNMQNASVGTDGRWEFADCTWLTADLTGEGNPYSLTLYIKKNETGMPRDPYTVYILDGSGDRLGSLKIVLSND